MLAIALGTPMHVRQALYSLSYTPRALSLCLARLLLTIICPSVHPGPISVPLCISRLIPFTDSTPTPGPAHPGPAPATTPLASHLSCLYSSVCLSPACLSPGKNALGSDGWSVRERLTGVRCLEKQLLRGRREASY